jgi:hypothetical protein
MYHSTALIRCAGRIRQAREALTDIRQEFSDVCPEQIMLELGNAEVQLEEIYLKLMQPFEFRSTPRRRPACDGSTQELPF